MPAVTAYEPGQFNWVDLMAHDLQAASQFYGALFGWTAVEQDTQGGPPYIIFQKEGQDVAGGGQMNEQMKGQGIPPLWNSYVAVDDVQAVAAKAADLGGAVMMPPMQVLQAGWMAFLQDPAGATLAVWQKIEHLGAALVNEPGSFCWNELLTRDTGRAREFYGGLFGWQFEEHTEAPTDYFIIKCAGRDNGGVMQMDEQWGEIPPHWTVYFAVDDTDAAVQTVQQEGGRVNVPPFDVPVGRISIVSDPQGAAFSLIRLNNPGG